MTHLPLVVSPEAEQDALEAARWYEDRAKGLGVSFLEIVEQTQAGILENPRRFPVVHRGVRRALLIRFPYGVFFRLKPQLIKVIAVTHLSRDPATWRRRR